MQVIREINYIFDRKQKVKLGILMIAIFISSILELIGVTIILPFVNAIITPDKLLSNKYIAGIYEIFGFSNINELIAAMVAVIIIVYIIKNIYMIILGDWQFRFVYNNQRRISCQIMETYMKQPYLFHVSHNTSELMRNVSSDTEVFFRAVLATLQLVTDACICIVLFVYLFITDKSITIAICIFMISFILFYVKIFRKKISYYGKQSRGHDAEMKKWVLQAFGGVKEAQIMNREDFFVNNYNKTYRAYADYQRKNNVLSIIPKPLVETMCIAALLIMVALKLMNGVNAEYFLPIITAFAVAAFKMMPSFNKITGNLAIIMFCRPAVSNIYTDKKHMEELIEKQKRNISRKEILFEKELRIEQLKFRYPEASKNVLDGITITIPKNKSIALIGPSGSGKTTLADIILGALEPTEGCVLADGENIHQSVIAWHENVGYIPQNIYLMDDTIRNNIAFGLEEEKIDESKIQTALKLAQLDAFVDTLESGLNTIIGEGGVRLSGGQRQRIGIARALYNNPEVLVLDEATSALDNDTETAVMEAIDNLAGTKTLIIIAHRLSTIRNCDIIFEVKDGRVNEMKEKLEV